MSNNEPNPTPQYGAYGQVPYAPAPPPPQAFAHPKPGIVPLRPLSLGDIFAGAWSAVWHNPAVMLGLSLLIILVTTILSALIGLLLNAPLAHLNNELLHQGGLYEVLRDLQIDPQNLTFFTGASSAAGLLMAFATPIINGILAISISQSVLGNRMSMGDAWGRVKGRVGALIGWSLLMTLALIAAAFIGALAIAGVSIAASHVSTGLAIALAVLMSIALTAVLIWLSVKLLFVAPIIAIERSSIGQAVRRSWELTRGHFWRIFGIYLLGTLLVGLISSLVTFPLSLLTGALNFGAAATGTAVGVGGGTLVLDIIRIALSNLITMAFTSGLLTLLYLDTRMRSEGLHDSLISSTSNAPVSNSAATGW